MFQGGCVSGFRACDLGAIEPEGFTADVESKASWQPLEPPKISCRILIKNPQVAVRVHGSHSVTSEPLDEIKASKLP